MSATYQTLPGLSPYVCRLQIPAPLWLGGTSWVDLANKLWAVICITSELEYLIANVRPFGALPSFPYHAQGSDLTDKQTFSVDPWWPTCIAFNVHCRFWSYLL